MGNHILLVPWGLGCSWIRCQHFARGQLLWIPTWCELIILWEQSNRMNRKRRNYCFSLNYRLPYIVLKCFLFFFKEIALITLFHLHWTAFPSLSMGWQLSWLVHGSTNWQSESVNLELPKLFLQPNVPHTHPLETASLMHCGQERCLSAPEHWLKITSYHHRSLRWQSFLWGAATRFS